MRIDEVWMRLEALAHLRQLPKLSNLKAKIEDELAAMDEDLRPKSKEVAPLEAPSEEEEEPLRLDEEAPDERRI